MKNFFTAEDFIMAQGYTGQAEEIAATVNQKLKKLIESWPVVYQNPLTTIWSPKSWKSDTHKARLAFIEEIKKEPCKHEPEIYDDRSDNTQYFYRGKCKHCGVELIAEWKEKKC